MSMRKKRGAKAAVACIACVCILGGAVSILAIADQPVRTPQTVILDKDKDVQPLPPATVEVHAPNVELAGAETPQQESTAETMQVTKDALPEKAPATPSATTLDWTFGDSSSGGRDDPTCPPGSLFDQPPTPATGGWTAGVCDKRTGSGYSELIRYEDFSGGGEICDIHFWGLTLSYPWAACTEDPMTFEVIFYNDAAGAPGTVACGPYTLDISGVDTGEAWSGFVLYEFSAFLNPCCSLAAGWVSIQGTSVGSPDCWFLWASHGETGDGMSLLYDVDLGTWTTEVFDLSLCLTGEYVPVYGACCDDCWGICTNGVEQLDCEAPKRFAANTPCAFLDPPCGPLGACCDADLDCLFTDVECECDAVVGTWYEGEDCDAGFECPAECDHTICLTDDYGDGWNGGLVDVLVNGNPVLTGLTILTGYGPECYIFSAATGDTITTVYTPGSWAYENEYWITDGAGIEICRDGAGGTQPVGITCTGNCVIPTTGACCDPDTGDCHPDMTEALCTLLYPGGDFYLGIGCVPNPCPQPPPACPDDSLLAQLPHDPADGWSAATSSETTAFHYRVYENFSALEGQVCDIHWWGLPLVYNAGWFPCPDPMGLTFEIIFWEDDGGMPGAAVCTYTGVVPDAVTNTGLLYAAYPMYYWEVLTLAPCCDLESGWVSIKGELDAANDCAFLWQSSPDGDGDSLQEIVPGTPTSTLFDRAVCLTGVYVPSYGACCDDATTICVDGVEKLDCEAPKRFAVDTLCDDLYPPCGEASGACCDDVTGECLELTAADCAALPGHTYLGAGTDCDPNPCPQPPPPNDLCEDATLVEGPYPVQVYGDNTNATIDCPGVLDWPATWWEITLPYESNNLHIDYCLTAPGVATAGIVVMDDCLCDDYIIADYYAFIYCPDQNLEAEWYNLPGPGTILFPAHYIDANGNGMPYGMNIDVTVPPVPPENDECENAEELGDLPASVVFNNSLATDDNPPACGENTSGPYKNVWYSVVGTGNTMTASTCNEVSDGIDTRISVFCGDCPEGGSESDCCVGHDYPGCDDPVCEASVCSYDSYCCDVMWDSLCADEAATDPNCPCDGGGGDGLICVGGDDDDCAEWYVFSSTVHWCSQYGATYYITVGTYSASTVPGELQLDVSDGDNCCGEAVVDCGAPVGGCCLPDTSCEVMDEYCCEYLEGLYLGDGTDCDAEMGACCQVDGSCTLATEDCCYYGGGYRWVAGEGCGSSGDIVEQLAVWTADVDPYGPGAPQSFDLSAYAGMTAQIEFRYYGDSWDWYAEVDNVSVSPVLFADFNAGIPGDWTLVDTAGNGFYWMLNTDTGRTNYAGGDGACAIADQDWFWGYPYDTSLLTPWFVVPEGATLDFILAYNYLGTGEAFEVNIVAAGEPTGNPCSVDSCLGVNQVKLETKCGGISYLLVEEMSSGTLFEFVPDDNKCKLTKDVEVDGPDCDKVKIHTSCSRPIEVGYQYFDKNGCGYEVLAVTKISKKQHFKGTFAPGSEPFDPVIDSVTYTIDAGPDYSYSLVIPPGSFEDEDDGKYKFKRKCDVWPYKIDGKFDFEKCSFQLKIDNIGWDVLNPNDVPDGTDLTFTIRAGLNYGEDTVTMALSHNGKKLEYKAHPKKECCPKCKGVAYMQVTSGAGNVLEFLPDEGKEKLHSNTVVDDGECGEVEIHTSCSQPIDIGDVHSGEFCDYEITDLIKIFEDDGW